MMTWSNFFFNMPSSYLMEFVLFLSDYISMFIFSVLIFVGFMMFFSVFFKFFDLYLLEHNQMEIIWTILPFIILFFICIPSLYCLYFIDTCLFCGISVKIMGHQWYWSYFYDFSFNQNFDSYMVLDSDFRLIETDNSLVLPISVPVRLMISSYDVLHSWTIPSLGLKTDAVPGRVNQICVTINKSGLMFGQCSEICGANHSFMPISLETIPSNLFFSIFI